MGAWTTAPMLWSHFQSGHLPGKAPQLGNARTKNMNKAHAYTSKNKKT